MQNCNRNQNPVRFFISLESSFFFPLPPLFQVFLPPPGFFPSYFLAEIERDENCGLICGNAAISRIHLVSYESRTRKSVILLENMNLRAELPRACVLGTDTDRNPKSQVLCSSGKWVYRFCVLLQEGAFLMRFPWKATWGFMEAAL